MATLLVHGPGAAGGTRQCRHYGMQQAARLTHWLPWIVAKGWDVGELTSVSSKKTCSVAISVLWCRHMGHWNGVKLRFWVFVLGSEKINKETSSIPYFLNINRIEKSILLSFESILEWWLVTIKIASFCPSKIKNIRSLKYTVHLKWTFKLELGKFEVEL